jgi:hypothetical protein
MGEAATCSVQLTDVRWVGKNQHWRSQFVRGCSLRFTSVAVRIPVNQLRLRLPDAVVLSAF